MTYIYRSELPTDVQEALEKIETNLGGRIHGDVPGRIAFCEHEWILEMLALKYEGIFSRDDLVKMMKDLDPDDIGPQERVNFYRTDLVIKTKDMQSSGEVRLVAVIASYIANLRCTNRALRAAKILERCTRHEAIAVVAGITHDPEILPLVDAGMVAWYQFRSGDPQAQEPQLQQPTQVS